MRLGDLIAETLYSLTANKVRSGLTILGIVVGIASVIAMVAIGAGSQASIEESIQSAGANLLTVSPSAGGMMMGAGARSSSSDVKTLTRDDAEALATLSVVSGVAPATQGQGQIITAETNANAILLGVTDDYAGVKGLTMAYGSFISDRNDELYGKVIVLGATLAETLYGEDADPVGETLRCGDLVYTVIGVLNEKGTSGMTDVDSAAMIPLSTYSRYISGSESLSSVTVAVANENAMDAAEAVIEAKLLSLHGIASADDADFRIQNMADMLETASDVTSTFTTLLAGIASISLLVGGIGIMNMMLTTVTERTREIGLRKAVGASSGAISAQFLAESVTLTLTGGALGILAGWAIGTIAANLLGASAIMTPDSVLLAVGVCTVIGIVFGYYPARRAASLSPIEALRYQ